MEQPTASKKLKEDAGSLLRDCAAALRSEYNADVSIVAGEGDNQKTFKVNSFMVTMRCEYFRTCFQSEMKEGQSKTLYKPNISPQVMSAILLYLYTGETDVYADTVYSLLMAADELGLQDLHRLALDYQLECLTPETVLEVVHLAVQHHEEEVAKQGRQFILENARDVFQQPQFLELDEDSLVDLFSSDDLRLSEEELWTHMLRWGYNRVEQESAIRIIAGDELRLVLKNLVPLVRLFQLGADFIMKQVEPLDMFSLSDILDAHHFRLNPKSFAHDHKWAVPRCPSSGMDLSAAALAKIFKEIGKQYRLQLLFRASRDDFDAFAFHRLCDKQGPTLTVAHVKGAKEGERYTAAAYNPLSWSALNVEYTRPTSKETCLLFAINPPNGQGFTCFKPKVSSWNQFYSGSKWGPCFGSNPDDLELLSPMIEKGYGRSCLGTYYTGPRYFVLWAIFFSGRRYQRVQVVLTVLE